VRKGPEQGSGSLGWRDSYLWKIPPYTLKKHWNKQTNKQTTSRWFISNKNIGMGLYFQTSLSSTAGFSMWEELGKSQWELLTVKMVWFSGSGGEKPCPTHPTPGKAIPLGPCGTIAPAHWEGFSSVLCRSQAHTSAGRQSRPQTQQTSRLPWGSRLRLDHMPCGEGILSNLGHAYLFLTFSWSHFLSLPPIPPRLGRWPQREEWAILIYVYISQTNT
jgi:hypothetical protein